MCGIFGTVGNEINAEKMVFLGLLSQKRGIDAAGFWTPEFGVLKQPGSFYKFAKKIEPFWRYIRYEKIFIGHTRCASHGSPKNNNNNHPLIGKKYVLVHNGIVRMKRIKGYRYKGETDSEIILSYLETKGRQGLKEVLGSASLVWTKPKVPNTIYMWRHRSPLVIGASGGVFYFASEAKFLWRIFKGKKKSWVKTLREHKVVRVTLKGKKVILQGLETIKPKTWGYIRRLPEWYGKEFQEYNEDFWRYWNEESEGQQTFSLNSSSRIREE